MSNRRRDPYSAGGQSEDNQHFRAHLQFLPAGASRVRDREEPVDPADRRAAERDKVDSEGLRRDLHLSGEQEPVPDQREQQRQHPRVEPEEQQVHPVRVAPQRPRVQLFDREPGHGAGRQLRAEAHPPLELHFLPKTAKQPPRLRGRSHQYTETSPAGLHARRHSVLRLLFRKRLQDISAGDQGLRYQKPEITRQKINRQGPVHSRAQLHEKCPQP